MAFGQIGLGTFASWGVASGCGKIRPSAFESHPRLPRPLGADEAGGLHLTVRESAPCMLNESPKPDPFGRYFALLSAIARSRTETSRLRLGPATAPWLTTWAEEGRTLSLHDTLDDHFAAGSAQLSRAIVNSVVVLISAGTIQRGSIGTIG